MFKGTNGRWRDVLTREELAQYQTSTGECLPAEAAEWLERGRSQIG